MIRKILILLATLISLPLCVYAETASDVIDRMIEAEKSSYDQLTRIFKITETMGHKIPEYMEKQGEFMIAVPISELFEEQQPNVLSDAPSETLRDAAEIIRFEGERADMELDLEMAKAGFGGFSGLLENPDPDKEWLATTPGGMMNLYATMLDASADSKDAIAQERLDNAAQAARNLELLEAAKARTRIIGRDNVDGMELIELGSDDLGMVQPVDDGTFTTNTVRISVHADSYVPVRFKIDGILEQGGESRPMTVERIDSGLSTHPGCNNLVVPTHSIMRLGGALTPEQEKELAEAQTQLAEFDKQMASMPPAQQEMMKRMVGPQIEMIKNMTSGGGIEVKSELIEVRCNDNMPTSQELTQKLM